MKVELRPKEEINQGDTVVYKANPISGVFVVIYLCTGFWGKPNGKVHVSGFAATHSDGAYHEERDVYCAEMVKVVVTHGEIS